MPLKITTDDILTSALQTPDQTEEGPAHSPVAGPDRSERRREHRYPTRDIADVAYLNPYVNRSAATVLDVSRSGLRIELPNAVADGSVLEVFLLDRAMILGEVRYCRRIGDVFHVGLLIKEVFYTQPRRARHVDDDQLALYLVGRGLSTLEVIEVKNHLLVCRECRFRLQEAEKYLRPLRQIQVNFKTAGS